MSNSKPRSLLALWPALRVTFFENVQYRDAQNLLAAATVPPAVFTDTTSVAEILDACDYHFKAPSHSSYLSDEDRQDLDASLHLKETQMEYLFSELLRLLSKRYDAGEARARLEEIAGRLHFYIVGTTIVPVELQVPQEITSLPEGPLAALRKAINRYRAGDTGGALTAICAAIDGACQELVGDSVPGWHDLNFVHKVQAAHKPCMARIVASSGLPPDELKIVAENNKRSVFAAAEVLARFRREYSDAHGIGQAPAGLVQIALDSAVYLLRVLAPR